MKIAVPSPFKFESLCTSKVEPVRLLHVPPLLALICPPTQLKTPLFRIVAPSRVFVTNPDIMPVQPGPSATVSGDDRVPPLQSKLLVIVSVPFPSTTPPVLS